MSIILNQLRPLLLNINLPKFGRHLNLLRNMRELLTNYEFIILKFPYLSNLKLFCRFYKLV